MSVISKWKTQIFVNINVLNWLILIKTYKCFQVNILKVVLSLNKKGCMHNSKHCYKQQSIYWITALKDQRTPIFSNDSIEIFHIRDYRYTLKKISLTFNYLFSRYYSNPEHNVKSILSQTAVIPTPGTCLYVPAWPPSELYLYRFYRLSSDRPEWLLLHLHYWTNQQKQHWSAAVQRPKLQHLYDLLLEGCAVHLLSS